MSSGEVKFQEQTVYAISHGEAKAWIAPQYGARLLRWSVGGRELILWPENADWSKVNKVRGGNPILFPFIARHMVDGKIGFWKDGDTVREMPMHGFARELPFEVVECTDSQIVMRLEANDVTRQYYPFEFRFDVQISLQKDLTLRIAMETTNFSERPMPYYLGHHFYFKLPKEEREQWDIQIPCSQTARQKPDGNITFNSKPQIETTFADEDLIDRFHIMENAQPVTFGRKQGYPRFRIRMDHPETIHWGAVTTWTEAEDSDFYCIEPWTGLPNAIHHLHGLRRIEPGATEKAICKIEALLSDED